MHLTLRPVALAAAVLSALTGGALCSVPALANAAAGPQLSVSLVLAPPSSGAGRTGALPPTPAEHRAVARALGALGLRVTSSEPLLVKASGPAALVDRVFGSARGQLAASPVGQPLPLLPASLQGLVTLAVGGDESRPLFAPLDASTGAATGPAGGPAAAHGSRAASTTGYDGRQLAAAYLCGAAGCPTPATGATASIATLELAGWHASDLSHYAQHVGIRLSAGQYTAVSVDGADPAAAGNGPGQAEVNLDLESELAVAPTARQRVYFAPDNGPAGVFDALSQIYDDATSSSPDYHITALVDSWGACERDVFTGGTGDYSTTTAQELESAFNAVLSYIVASGVTIFAGSGDSGTSAACVNQNGLLVGGDNVEFPASDPWVLGVGGTTLPAGTGDAPDAAAQTVWNDGAGNATGGGQSAVFATPSYQDVLTGVPGLSGRPTHRLVPDLASDADPQTGLDSYSTDTDPPFHGWQVLGGTSLAAPTQAAALTEELLADGYSHGVGDLHGSLYTLGASQAAGGGTDYLTDITADSPHGTGDVEPAAAGYDMATGWGTPSWSTLFPALVGAPHLSLPGDDVDSPDQTLTVSIPSGVDYVALSAPLVERESATSSIDEPTDPDCPSGVALSSPVAAQVPVTLGAGDGPYVVELVAEDASGHCHTALTQVLLDTRAPVVSRPGVTAVAGAHPLVRFSWTATDPGAGAAVPTGSGGASYTLAVSAVDRAGNHSATLTYTALAPLDDGSLGRSRGWRVHVNRDDYGGSARWASTRGDWMQIAVTGREIVLYVETTPASGVLRVEVDHHTRELVNLYSRHTRYRVALTVARFGAAGRHVLALVVTGGRARVSRGTYVIVDGLQVVP